MKKSINVKCAWEENEGFQIVCADGDSKSGGGKINIRSIRRFSAVGIESGPCLFG